MIVNDVYVDPKNPQHVMLATDRGGVLESDDAAATFKASNAGFSQRQVSSLLVDAKSPQTIFAGVVNDKTYRRCVRFPRRWRHLEPAEQWAPGAGCV